MALPSVQIVWAEEAASMSDDELLQDTRNPAYQAEWRSICRQELSKRQFECPPQDKES